MRNVVKLVYAPARHRRAIIGAMDESSLETIRNTAHTLADQGAKWHFHILTPTCSLNSVQRFAFILEDVDHHQTLVHHSEKMEQGLGAELSPLLHKVSLKPNPTPEGNSQPSAEVKQILNRAWELNQENVHWHHHVLFPGCIFNKAADRFTLVFEDPQQKVTLEQVSDSEPTADLALLEPLFYAQKKG
jgi:hypothetical protein